MPRQSAFVKVSGDVCTSPVFLEFVRSISHNYEVVVCVGGGTQINQAFLEAGLLVEKYGPLGRETKSLRERQLARDVLEENKIAVQDALESLKISATVVIPVLDIGSVLCHVNGDQMIRTVYLGFDKLYVVTTGDRVSQKRKEFASLPKVEVVSLSPS